MNKSEVRMLEGVLEAIIHDYLQVYPSDAVECERDLGRVSLASQTRGLGFFLLDLPAMGKHFDKCLATGLLTLSGVAHSGPRWPKSPVPRLFSGLVSRVFEINSGRLRSDADVNVILFLRQMYYFAKGYKHDCSFERTAQAVIDFYETDRALRSPSLNWQDDRLDLDRLCHLHFDDSISLQDLPVSHSIECRWRAGWDYEGVRSLQKGFDIVASSLGDFDPLEFRPKHGPGAVADLRSDESKYTFPNWTDKLDSVFPFADLAFANYADWADVGISYSFDSEAPSELISVPKSAKGPRLIAKEPTSHQWCQQILLKYFIRGIERSHLGNSIDLRDQTPSRELALQASQSGILSTIDLSAASDRISTWLVERAFRRNPTLIRALHASRTRKIINKIGIHHPEIPNGPFELSKFSTMGSACTFPVQSIVFATIATVTILIFEGRPVTPSTMRWASKSVRVFGDDIIIPTKYDEAVRGMLTILGLKVNHDKSFSQGLFRESCGMDAYAGYEVTPARINCIPNNAKPQTVMSTLDASNNFFMKGFWHTAHFIESLLPRWVRRNSPIVDCSLGEVGLTSFCGSDISHLDGGWDPYLQQEVVKALKLKSSVGHYAQDGRLDLFQYFTEQPDPEVIWSPGRVKPSKQNICLGKVPSRYYIRLVRK
ncbi:TPA_asm: RNA-directed RNA polymerase [ssRNA phage SRR7976325_25]|uniref:RNA-directed RNA polymerase n=1 Tax=ssRNA phage SRR7976325_25 TaxID=2786713 RepID=A0A8S5L0M8_9VIRU|nr:RNA-directed RNA polymerase [ssRNA phage SRR7976325_25]DAD51193.1 TPA_asm: RNA-directed RNA polymerase [ssRNA phage SRR7976325_25]